LLKVLEEEIIQNSQNLNNEFKRLFHGRGDLFEGFTHLTVDSIDSVLLITFYDEFESQLEISIIKFFKNYIKSSQHDCLLLQKRYIQGQEPIVLEGQIPLSTFAIENGLKFQLNLKANQNSGYFPDMKNGRSFIESIANNKNVLNLFSYTCGFSLSAIKGGANKVVNMDMSKNVLNRGRQNHLINNLDTKKVNFLPHNILKSFGKIKKMGPFDIVIIDPPTFQKGSFEASKDYIKIIKRLDDFTAPNSVVLSCLNAPNLDSSFIIDLFKEHASNFVFEKRIENLEEFAAKTEEKSLKNLVFVKQD
jgi:23S rRNA (cytosine1962-C5)-methyltransferase